MGFHPRLNWVERRPYVGLAVAQPARGSRTEKGKEMNTKDSENKVEPKRVFVPKGYRYEVAFIALVDIEVIEPQISPVGHADGGRPVIRYVKSSIDCHQG